HLTDEQRAAATHRGGHLLVVAGAGTGKTTALTARLASLVASGTDPSRILLLTFSRRAAAELLQRAEAAAGHSVARQAWGGTFHAVANRLLRRHGQALGLVPSFTVLDQADTAGLLGLVREELAEPGEQIHPSPSPSPGVRRRRAKPETMAAILSRVVNSRTPVSAVVARHFPWCGAELDDLKATFSAYTARKRAAQVLDFDDLLLCWQALFEVPGVGNDLRRRFDHVLVDEYQDTNALQADLLGELAAGGATVTAVGDDAQAIYGFRSADVRNILDFPDRFGAVVARLEQSHRSTPPLVAFTNAVIAEAPERHEKHLWSARAGTTRPALVTCADEGAQSAAVCERLLDHLERGTALRAQAVLVRTGHHSDLLELELAVRGIPFVKYGGLRFLEAAHVKDLLAALRLVENPRDEMAWSRVLQLVDGVGPATARRLLAAAVGGDGDPRASLAGLSRTTGGPLAEAVSGLAEALVDAAAPRLTGQVGAQVDRIRRWLDPQVAARHGDATARLADLDQLSLAASGAPTLGRFLVELTLDPPASTGDLAGPPSLDDDVLTLSTIHSAKGLEWDVVHVLHLADGCIPSDMATGRADEIEEERRLLYVALTRARNALYAYVPLRYHHHRRGRDDAHGYAQRSRFLTPAVLDHVDHQGAAPVAEPEPPPQNRPPVGLGSVDRRLAALFE
ncbi:MAG: ATP-dependent helicase, partial [Acidimicrobiales bacterium]